MKPISVTERLPEWAYANVHSKHSDTVLGYCKDHRTWMTVIYNDRYGWESTHSAMFGCEEEEPISITHWLPLPEKPE